MSSRYGQLIEIISSKSYYSQIHYRERFSEVFVEDLLKFQVWTQRESEIPSSGYPISFVPGRRRELSYPFFETSGYMVETLINYQKLKHNDLFIDSAKITLDWLIANQNDDGSFPTNLNHFTFTKEPLIFDTGMILLGLNAGVKEFGDVRMSDSALRAIAWLNARLTPENTFESIYTFSKDEVFRSYYVKVIHAMLSANQLMPNAVDLDKCLAVYSIVVKMLVNKSLIPHAGFSRHYVHLHTVAYTIEALLKIAIMINDTHVISLIKEFIDEYFMAGLPAAYLSIGGFPISIYRCLVGEAQVAEILYLFSNVSGIAVYRNKANEIISNLMCKSYHHSESGGAYFYASYPSFGLYKPFEVVNWGAKFAADAILAGV